jgi:hypothetical protein
MGSHDMLPLEHRVVQVYLYLATINQEVNMKRPIDKRLETTVDQDIYSGALVHNILSKMLENY